MSLRVERPNMPQASGLARLNAALPAAKPALSPALALDRIPSASGQEAQGLEGMRRFLAAEAALPLQKGAESRLVESQIRPAKGVVVMLHGFSAAPWQMVPLAEKLAAEGYHAFIPRLPGHGLKDAQGKEDPKALPGAWEWQEYLDFADEAFQLAAATGKPVSAVGLSVGASAALAMAERHPEVTRVVAMAPFLRPKKGGLALDILRVINHATFGLVGALLGPIPWGWGKAVEAQTASGERPGHAIFNLGNLAGASNLGRHVIQSASEVKAEVQLFTTGADDAVGLDPMKKLAAGLGSDTLVGWQHYPLSEGIPHPMVHPFEANGKGHIEGLHAATIAFLDGGVPSRRPPPAQGE